MAFINLGCPNRRDVYCVLKLFVPCWQTFIVLSYMYAILFLLHHSSPQNLVFLLGSISYLALPIVCYVDFVVMFGFRVPMCVTV
jgi:hypothetical protein